VGEHEEIGTFSAMDKPTDRRVVLQVNKRFYLDLSHS
jgi:hypothetical protein